MRLTQGQHYSDSYVYFFSPETKDFNKWTTVHHTLFIKAVIFCLQNLPRNQ